jgi:hypothetical protein
MREAEAYSTIGVFKIPRQLAQFIWNFEVMRAGSDGYFMACGGQNLNEALEIPQIH